MTHGKARVLQDVARDGVLTWDSPEALGSLDLCLACKVCSRDCPAGIDVVRYGSEVPYRAYRGKLRPVIHYASGGLPLWARMVMKVPVVARIANAAIRFSPLRRLVFRLADANPWRAMPGFGAQRFSRSKETRSVRKEARNPRVAFREPWKKGLHGIPDESGVPNEKRGSAPERGKALARTSGLMGEAAAGGSATDELGAKPCYVTLWVDSFFEAFGARGMRAAVSML